MRMTASDPKRTFAIAQKSQISSRNLDLEFNSLDAQRQACEAYIKSQALRVGAWFSPSMTMGDVGSVSRVAASIRASSEVCMIALNDRLHQRKQVRHLH
jgi:hypothetical protein